jgi:hypothetical protein
MTDDAVRAQLAALQTEVQRLRDLDDIRQLRARYFLCVDHQEWERWGKEVLTDDFHFESDAGVQDGRDLVVREVGAALVGAQTVHHGHTPLIELTGPDTATGIWAMNDYVNMPSDGSGVVLRGYGWYHDEYVRTSEGWRLKSCRMERHRVDVTGLPEQS